MKDPAYRDTMYVDDLVAPNTVNTMPAKTLEAVADHGEITGDQVTGTYADAKDVLDSLERLGVSYADVVAVLEREGVDKFEKSWGELLTDVQEELDQGRDRRLVRRGGQVTHVALGVVAAGPAADASRQHVPTLVGDRFASRLFAQDATLWGPEAEAEVGDPAVAGPASPASSRPLVGEVAALREQLREQGLDHVVLVRHGRLVAGARGHLRHGRGGPRRSWTPPTPTTCGPPCPTGWSAPSWWSPASPGRPSRPTRQRRAYEAAFTRGRASTRPARIVVVTDPGSPLDEEARAARLPGRQRRPRTSAAATPR